MLYGRKGNTSGLTDWPWFSREADRAVGYADQKAHGTLSLDPRLSPAAAVRSNSKASMTETGLAIPCPAISNAHPCPTLLNSTSVPIVIAAARWGLMSLIGICPWS